MRSFLLRCPRMNTVALTFTRGVLAVVVADLTKLVGLDNFW
jgi:hypothetical protein